MKFRYFLFVLIIIITLKHPACGIYGFYHHFHFVYSESERNIYFYFFKTIDFFTLNRKFKNKFLLLEYLDRKEMRKIA